ncbi:MAG TPA: FliM/FliN family flagellar motor switch protein [Terriglobales bacterium]|nr:FliM/FliN family flagellar motor switch protein [Terriglobales bacterium]
MKPEQPTPGPNPGAPEAAGGVGANDAAPGVADAASGIGAKTLRPPLHAVWEDAALAVLRQLSGDPAWSAEPESHNAAPPPPIEIAAHAELSGALHGMMQLRLHRAAARAWAHLRPASVQNFGIDAAPASGPISEAELEALADALRRLVAAAAAELEAGGWGPVQITVRHLGPLRRTVENGESEFPLRFRHPDGRALELDIGIDSALRDQFRQGPLFDRALGDDRPAAAARQGSRWDLLLDIELDVTLRFGGRQMLLHDVLDLAPGSVLELDRDIDDPVELLVGGKIIAWGEVVVVDGNYGLRISRLLRRRERIAAMGVDAAVATEAGVAVGGRA